MNRSLKANHTWLTDWLTVNKVRLWGVANLAGFSTPLDSEGRRYPAAISWAVPMSPRMMADIQKGPNQAYADAYAAANDRINTTSVKLAKAIITREFQALALAASDRTDKKNIKGDFPHKTAATRAGLGWIGRHCQLITRKYGPWIRLGTIFTDMALTPSTPIERSFCGNCKQCVDACPAGALIGTSWSPGLHRAKMLNVNQCDRWKKEHYFQFHQGHNCGICSAVCPFGLKTISKQCLSSYI